MSKIPVSVLVMTKNEESNIERCLKALADFDEVIVVDSHSEDKTIELARGAGAEVVLFKWDGLYPKKRQWCLDTLKIRHNWVFWVDADEVLSIEIVEEIRVLFKSEPQCAGYFVKGQYIWRGKPLKYGLMNNKLALFDRWNIEFPVVDDLEIMGMGEIEGHYQPVLKDESKSKKLQQLKNSLLHHAYDNEVEWLERHKRYANWEAGMTECNAWPVDLVRMRQILKNLTRTSVFRPYYMFFYSYLFKLGFMDGIAGYQFALSRTKYCGMVRKELSKL